jgi:hypothetical protein
VSASEVVGGVFEAAPARLFATGVDA